MRLNYQSIVNPSWTWLIFLVIFIATACGSDAEATPTTVARVEPASSVSSAPSTTIVAMGDSLTEGLGVEPELAYPAQLEKRLHQNGHAVTVINAGISGETSSGALTRVDWILNLEPDIVILVTGGNDGLRGIAPTVTHDNIDTIVTSFIAQDVTVILGGMQIVQNMGSDYVEEFRAIYPAVAEAHNLLFVPFFLEGVAGEMSLNQPDEIHPTADGYSLVVDTIYPYVEEALAP